MLLMLLVVCAAAEVFAAQTLDTTNQEAVLAATKAAVKWLGYYYTSPANDGAWDQKLVQWHESGEFWNTYFRYRLFVGPTDTSYDSWLNQQMYRASFGPVGNFLNDNGDGGLAASTFQGKWNDDIGWWGVASLAGGRVYGLNSKVSEYATQSTDGATWQSIATATFNQMLQQWDTQCGGGIYWSRDRSSSATNQKYYKSSITNSEAIHIAGILYAATKNETYHVWADKIYAWMKATVILADYSIADGVMADGSCALDSHAWTYHAGELISGLVEFYKATQNSTYLQEAQNLMDKTTQQFVNSNTGAIWDPTCGYNGGDTNCKNPSGYAWAMYEGYATFYAATTNTTAQSLIQKIMTNSLNQILSTCDSTWNCIRTLSPVPSKYTFSNGTNPRDQIEAVNILTTLSIIASNGVMNIAPVVATPTTTTKSSPSVSVLYSSSFFVVSTLLFCVAISLFFVQL